jgi:hypothetical protein
VGVTFIQGDQFAQHRECVAARTFRVRHRVRALVDDRVEPCRQHAAEPPGLTRCISDQPGVDDASGVIEGFDEHVERCGLVFVRDSEHPRHVVSGSGRDEPERNARACDKIDAEINHAVAADDDERIRLLRDFSLGGGDELSVARLEQVDDVVAEAAQPVDHRAADALVGAEPGGRIDRHNEAFRAGRLRHDLIMTASRPQSTDLSPEHRHISAPS